MVSHTHIITMYNKKTLGKDDLKDEDKINILSDIAKPKKYIGYKEKQEKAKDVIRKNVTSENGSLLYNSCSLYYDFMCMILNTYYGIDILSDTFDALCSSNILGYLMVMLSDEYEIFKNILDSYMNDLKNGNLPLESL